ncbi:MAG: hypothetical protein K2P17_05920 [Helicobacteraceae bacterium]|nr:hypothetical protein [Helicobacteraceae bacterium]
MIKKILLVSVACLACVFGSFEDNVAKLIEKETQTKVKVVSTSDLKSNKDIKLVVIEIENNSQRIPMFATKNGNLIIGLSNIMFSSSSADNEIIAKIAEESTKHNESSQQNAAGKLIDQLKPEQYVTLKSSAKNPGTYFIVADPNCGYCREEFKRVDEKLKTHNVNIVIVGILGEDSLKKAAYAVENIKSNMSEKDKLKKFKEIFSNSFKTPKSIDTTKVKETTEFLFKTGVIRGVPFIYEKK